MATEKKKDPKRFVVTGRVSFPKVFKAESFKDQKAKYSCTILIPQSTDLTDAKKAVFAAKKEADWGGEDKTKWPKTESPFHDGNEKSDLEGYKGMITITAKNSHRPEVVNKELEPIMEESGEFYAGCYAKFAVRAFSFGGGKTGIRPGVSFSLEAIQKIGEGEPFSGKPDISEVFSKIEGDGSGDASNYEDNDATSSEEDETW